MSLIKKGSVLNKKVGTATVLGVIALMVFAGHLISIANNPSATNDVASAISEATSNMQSVYHKVAAPSTVSSGTYVATGDHGSVYVLRIVSEGGGEFTGKLDFYMIPTSSNSDVFSTADAEVHASDGVTKITTSFLLGVGRISQMGQYSNGVLSFGSMNFTLTDDAGVEAALAAAIKKNDAAASAQKHSAAEDKEVAETTALAQSLLPNTIPDGIYAYEFEMPDHSYGVDSYQINGNQFVLQEILFKADGTVTKASRNGPIQYATDHKFQLMSADASSQIAGVLNSKFAFTLTFDQGNGESATATANLVSQYQLDQLVASARSSAKH